MSETIIWATRRNVMKAGLIVGAAAAAPSFIQIAQASTWGNRGSGTPLRPIMTLDGGCSPIR